jgi:hypothetical protein
LQFANWIARWKDSLVNRAGFSNETSPFEVGFWNQSHKVAHKLSAAGFAGCDEGCEHRARSGHRKGNGGCSEASAFASAAGLFS